MLKHKTECLSSIGALMIKDKCVLNFTIPFDWSLLSQMWRIHRKIIHLARTKIQQQFISSKGQGDRLWCFMNITVSLHFNVRSLRQMNWLIEYACSMDEASGCSSALVSFTLISFSDGFPNIRLNKRFAAIRFILYRSPTCLRNVIQCGAFR